jgi:hypothetical protein
VGAFSFRPKVQGIDQVLKRLDGTKRGVRNGVLRPAIGKGCTVALKAIKAKCPTDTNPHLSVRGLLKKSLGKKVKAARSGRIYGLVGPRRGFRTQVGVSKTGKPKYQDPAKIAHLVEFGHGGPAPAPAHSFIRSGWDQSRSAVPAAIRIEAEVRLAKLAQGRADFWSSTTDE